MFGQHYSIVWGRKRQEQKSKPTCSMLHVERKCSFILFSLIGGTLKGRRIKPMSNEERIETLEKKVAELEQAAQPQKLEKVIDKDGCLNLIEKG